MRPRMTAVGSPVPNQDKAKIQVGISTPSANKDNVDDL